MRTPPDSRKANAGNRVEQNNSPSTDADIMLVEAMVGDLSSAPVEEQLYCVQRVTAAVVAAARRASYPETVKAEKLTARQREILFMLGAGKTPIVIATELHISRRTVEWHISNLQKAFDERTYKGVIRKAQSFGILL